MAAEVVAMRKKHFVVAALVLWVLVVLRFGCTPSERPKVFGLLSPGEARGGSAYRAKKLHGAQLFFSDKHYLWRILAEPHVALLGLDETWLQKHLHARAISEQYLVQVSVEGRPPSEQATLINASFRVFLRELDETEWADAQEQAADSSPGPSPTRPSRWPSAPRKCCGWLKNSALMSWHGPNPRTWGSSA